MKKITVVITSYNQKDYLKEAIESVLAQSISPHEIIVCDDESSDGSRELIASYEERYPALVKGLLHEKNLGISANRSSGIKKAEGELVTWLDGDDRYKPRKLEVELKALEGDSEARWAYSQVDIINDNGEKTGVRYNNPPTGHILDTLAGMLGGAPRNQLVYHKSLMDMGLFRDDMEMYEDFDLCLRLAKNYKAVYCPEAVVEYRIHGGGIHNIENEKHLVNLEKLIKYFKELVSDLDENKRIQLEKKLLNSVNRNQQNKARQVPGTIFRAVSKIFGK